MVFLKLSNLPFRVLLIPNFLFATKGLYYLNSSNPQVNHFQPMSSSKCKYSRCHQGGTGEENMFRIGQQCEAGGVFVSCREQWPKGVSEGRILRFIQSNFPTSDKGPGASVTDVSNVSKQVSCRFGEAAAIVMGVECDHLCFSEKRGKATPRLERPSGWRQTWDWSRACGSEIKDTGPSWPAGTSGGPRWTRRTGTRKQVGGSSSWASHLRTCLLYSHLIVKECRVDMSFPYPWRLKWHTKCSFQPARERSASAICTNVFFGVSKWEKSN